MSHWTSSGTRRLSGTTDTRSRRPKPFGEPWQDDYLLTGYNDEDEGYWSSTVTAQSRNNALAAWVRGDSNDDMIDVVGYDKDTSRLEHQDEGDDSGDEGTF